MSNINTIVVEDPVTNVVEVITPGAQGIQGIPGDFVTYTAEALEQMKKGQPLYINNAKKVALAHAGDTRAAGVAGVCYEDVEATFQCKYVTYGEIAIDDWTDIIGSENLDKGNVYFLSSVPGQMDLTPPSNAGEYVVKLGRATKTNRFDLQIDPSILL